MKLIVVRHTTLDIENGICYGQSDVLPSNNFTFEAEEVKDKVSKFKPNRVYSSPLKRCTLLAESCGFSDIHLEQRLIELNFGDWEMLPWDNIHGEYAQKWMDDYINFPTPNGECLLDMTKRIDDFIIELQKTDYKEVLCFTHSGSIRIIEHLVNNIPLEKLFDIQVEYGGVYIFNI